ncbi:MAG: AmmeMemoRadiSam system protein B, partial [Bdellovibrionales bacterium]|nr:AmmeMemoRadiSam system protein B [Bdellovibrionales bacterium]
FYAEQQAIRDRFAASSVREPMMAGAGYAKNRDELVRELERYMGSEPEPETEPADPLVALVVPHIDYRRGSHGYGQTYKKLRNQNHDVYLLLGTAHQYSPHLFHLTTKDFETPLGTLKNKRSVVETLAHSYGVERSFADEFLHKREHSLELQTPFLAHLQPQAEIIPILVGSLHQCIRKNTYPEELEIYESFVGELASITRGIVQAGSSLCIIGGVDMAHVGRSFGDPGALSPQSMEAIAERDHQYLQAISARDKHALFDHIAEDGDARRICGYPSLYVMLDLLERLEVPYEVEQDYYHQAVDYRNDCAVTFAGLSFYERKLPHDAIHGNP